MHISMVKKDETKKKKQRGSARYGGIGGVRHVGLPALRVIVLRHVCARERRTKQEVDEYYKPPENASAAPQ